MDSPNPIQRAKVEHSIQDVVAMGSVLSTPRWARIWHSINILTDHDDIGTGRMPTAADIIEETGIPQTTVYDDLDTLVDLQAIDKGGKTSSGAARYRTRGGHLMVHSGDPNDEEDYLSPVTVGVVGSAYDNDDIELFVKRNGYNVLHHCCLLVGKALDESEFDDLSEVAPDLQTADAHLIEDTIRDVREQLEEETLWGL
ncbi:MULTISPECIES: hypothetical protein [unclassified Natrinema]|uniref:hypothetical protein n=1 Tax=unclassified Natrinema TaxID=2622230 RepID=UPI0011AE3639|nr:MULTISPECIES: hypothetical protein [unclassified Natrinema]